MNLLGSKIEQDMDQENAHVPKGIRRLLIITDAWKPQINGVVRVLETLCQKLAERGHVTEIISPQRFLTVPCPSYPEIPLSLFPGRRLSGMIDDFCPDAIHIATEGPLGNAARRYCLKHNLPFTTAYHTKFPEYVHARTRLPLNWLYAVMKRFHAPSKAIMAPSASVYRELTVRGFGNARQWSHGVDSDKFCPGDKGFLDLPRPILMFVGRIAVEKNLPAFLQLDYPGSKVVVGNGPDRDRLMRKYPDVHFLIAHGDDELSRYFSAADVFVFPSRTDTFGLTMIEAMACGVPVAAFPVTGPLDVLGLTGPGETDAGCLDEDLSHAVTRAITKASEDCRTHALQFSWDRVADEFLDFLAPFETVRGS